MKASQLLSNKIKKSSLGSIAILSSGSFVAQLITFACSPLLTRLYSASDVGVFTIVLSIVAMFSTIICLRYDVPLVTATTIEYGSLIRLSIEITLALSIAIGAASIWYAFSPYGIEEGYRWSVSFVAPLLVVAGIINILNACNNRSENYSAISKAYVARSAFQSIIMVIGGLFTHNAATLLVSQLVGQLAGMREQYKGSDDALNRALESSQHDAQLSAIEHKDQALFSTPATLLNSASYSMVSMIVGNLFGMSILGLYSVSFRVLGAPLAIFSSNIAKVHCKQSEAELSDTGIYIYTTLRMIVLSIVIILPIGLLLFFCAPIMFKAIFGNQWYTAGLYVRILTPMFCFRFIAGSIGFGFFLSQRQWQEMLIQAILLMSLFAISLATAALSLDVEGFLTTLSVVWSIVYIFEIVLFLWNARRGA